MYFVQKFTAFSMSLSSANYMVGDEFIFEKQQYNMHYSQGTTIPTLARINVN